MTLLLLLLVFVLVLVLVLVLLLLLLLHHGLLARDDFGPMGRLALRLRSLWVVHGELPSHP